MIDKSKKPELIRNKYGFYQYVPAPPEEELRAYYAEKYFQMGRGSYSVSYSDEEIMHFRLKAWLLYRKVSTLTDLETKRRFVDIGCGEGWVLAEFRKQGHCVAGLDFSRHGIEKFHPDLLCDFEQGNIFELLNQKMARNEKFDIMLLGNVIEHVVDPISLLEKIKALMTADSVLIIVAPNDFSPLHDHLLTHNFIDTRFWLCYPDHLSYFNKDSMSHLLSEVGFKLEAVVGDNPIDINLLNDNSNYVKDEAKGKNTHSFRVRTDNFLAGINPEKLLHLYEVLGSMGIGRNLIYYCALAQ